MKIEDNFLEQKIFDELQAYMMSNNIDWNYNDGIDFRYEDFNDEDRKKYEEDRKKFQFTHLFYNGVIPCSHYFDNLGPILDIINPMSIWRIKANLLTITPNIIKNAFHVDILDLPEEKLKQWTTAILYVNTNNGYTKFEDGTKVESVANRVVIFPANLKHTGTSCSDDKARIVINFDYFRR